MNSSALTVSHSILRMVAEVDEFKGRWSALNSLSDSALDQLKSASNLHSGEALAWIEGERSEPGDEQSEAGGTDLQERESAGYAAGLEFLDGALEEQPLTLAGILQVHVLLLQGAGGCAGKGGRFKRNPNYAAEFDAQGRQTGVLFSTTGPAQVSADMNELLAWLEEERELHPLVAVAFFVFKFLAIHPFEEGNGKMSLLLAESLLRKKGYGHASYVSLGKIIEENHGDYYAALRRTHQSLKWPTPDWEPWLAFFLVSLVRQKRELEKRIEAGHAVPIDLSGLALAIFRLLDEAPMVTVSSVMKATGAKRYNVRTTLKGLVQRSLLAPRGKGNKTHYVVY